MILLRHGESRFNAAFAQNRIDPGISDPELTETGQAQALAAAAELGGRDLAGIISSPYTRALQTASIVAEALGLPIEIDPLIGERAAMSCDIGTPAAELMIRWPHLDLSHLPGIWWPDLEEPHSGVERRAAEFRTLVAARPDRERLLVVSHWGFIRALTGQEVGNAGIVHYRW